MDLKIKDIAEVLQISEGMVKEMLSKNQIPGYSFDKQVLFSSIECEEWILQFLKRNVHINRDQKHNKKKRYQGLQKFSLFRAFNNGDILFSISGENKEKVIRQTMGQVASCMLEADPLVISELLIDRERQSSTAIGNGIAIPHTQEFSMTVAKNVIVIACLKKSVPWDGIDQKSVSYCFFLFSYSKKSHLDLLAKLSLLIQSEQMMGYLKNTKLEKQQWLQYVREWESQLS